MKNTVSCPFSVADILALVVGLTLVASVAHAQETVRPGERGDYLVTQGKRPVWASQVVKMADNAGMHQVPSTGYFVTEGKQISWRTGTPPEAVAPLAPSSIPSKGHFVQNGKHQQWIEDHR